MSTTKKAKDWLAQHSEADKPHPHDPTGEEATLSKSLGSVDLANSTTVLSFQPEPSVSYFLVRGKKQGFALVKRKIYGKPLALIGGTIGAMVGLLLYLIAGFVTLAVHPDYTMAANPGDLSPFVYVLIHKFFFPFFSVGGLLGGGLIGWALSPIVRDPVLVEVFEEPEGVVRHFAEHNRIDELESSTPDDVVLSELKQATEEEKTVVG